MKLNHLKKIILTAFLCITTTAFSQIKKERADIKANILEMSNEKGNWINNFPKDCFCCDAIYNLQEKPEITGPQVINCEKPITFSIKPCKGINVVWSISPNISFTGQGTGSITINPPYSAQVYTVTVTIRCGEKSVTNTKVFDVEKPKNCVPNFLVTVKQLANGMLKINAAPTAGLGVEHYWGIVYNGTYPNCTAPCISIPLANIQNGTTFGGYVNAAGVFLPLGMGTSVNSGTTPYGINYSGFPNNSCFKITHYVKCCGEWYRQTQCVSIGTSNLKFTTGTVPQPQITIGEVEKVN